MLIYQKNSKLQVIQSEPSVVVQVHMNFERSEGSDADGEPVVLRRHYTCQKP